MVVVVKVILVVLVVMMAVQVVVQIIHQLRVVQDVISQDQLNKVSWRRLHPPESGGGGVAVPVVLVEIVMAHQAVQVVLEDENVLTKIW